MSCSCIPHPAAKIIVKADTVYQVLNLDTGDSLMIEVDEDILEYAGERFKESYKTMDELFDVIRNAKKQNADKINAEYNSDNGISGSIFIDYIKEAAADEIDYTISNYIDYVIPHQGNSLL